MKRKVTILMDLDDERELSILVPSVDASVEIYADRGLIGPMEAEILKVEDAE